MLQLLWLFWVIRLTLQVLNLIPYNATKTIANYKASQEGSVQLFQKIVREIYGVRATVRREMGQEIAGACGQLATEHQKKSEETTWLTYEPEPTDIEESLPSEAMAGKLVIRKSVEWQIS